MYELSLSHSNTICILRLHVIVLVIILVLLLLRDSEPLGSAPAPVQVLDLINDFVLCADKLHVTPDAETPTRAEVR